MKALKEVPTEPSRLIFAGAFEPLRFTLYLTRQENARRLLVQDEHLMDSGDGIIHTLELSQEDVDSWVVTLHR